MLSHSPCVYKMTMYLLVLLGGSVLFLLSVVLGLQCVCHSVQAGLECNEEYIGDSARTFWEKFKEHLKAHSPLYSHQSR